MERKMIFINDVNLLNAVNLIGINRPSSVSFAELNKDEVTLDFDKSLKLEYEMFESFINVLMKKNTLWLVFKNRSYFTDSTVSHYKFGKFNLWDDIKSKEGIHFYSEDREYIKHEERLENESVFFVYGIIKISKKDISSVYKIMKFNESFITIAEEITEVSDLINNGWERVLTGQNTCLPSDAVNKAIDNDMICIGFFNSSSYDNFTIAAFGSEYNLINIFQIFEF